MMTTIKVKYISIKDATRSIRFDYLMMTPKWNKNQVSSQSKAQASVYKSEVYDNAWSVWKPSLTCLSE